MLSKRLYSISKYVCKDDVVVDIGSDHGLLCVYLKKNNLCKEVYACDISDNALEQGKKNFKKYNINIESYQSNGFDNLNFYYNCAVIAGMGTNTILNIINNPKCPPKLIISSNNDFYLLRKSVNKLNFTIVNEEIVLDNNHYYIILNLKKGKEYLSPIEKKYGLSNNKDYYKYLLSKNINISKVLPLNKKLKFIKERIILKKLIGKK